MWFEQEVRQVYKCSVYFHSFVLSMRLGLSPVLGMCDSGGMETAEYARIHNPSKSVLIVELSKLLRCSGTPNIFVSVHLLHAHLSRGSFHRTIS